MTNDTVSNIRDYETDMELYNDMIERISDSINFFWDSRRVSEGTLVLESEEEYMEETSTKAQNEKENRIKLLDNTVSRKIVNIDSYYDCVEEFYGVVESIDATTNTFDVLFKQDGDNVDEKSIRASFDMDDVQESDKKLLAIGTQLVWLIGKERKENNISGVLKPGGITNVSRIHIRRTRVLSQKKKTEIEEKADEWSRFFAGLNYKDQ